MIVIAPSKIAATPSKRNIGIWYAELASYGTVVEFGNDEIYYSGEASEDDARKLAEFLQEAGYFGDSGVSVRLEASSGYYTVSFVMQPGAWDDRETVDAFREFGSRMAPEVFPRPMTIQLCDEYFSPQATIEIR